LNRSAADSFPKLSATEDFAERFCESRALPINAGTASERGQPAKKYFFRPISDKMSELTVEECVRLR